MRAEELTAIAFDPSRILLAQGLTPDPWQKALLLCGDRQVLLNCCRQSGKSTTTAALALHTAIFQPASLTLLLSPGQRQSGEIFRKVIDAYNSIGRPIVVKHRSERTLELANGSRIVSLPGVEETVRSYSGVKLLILDEASRVPDELYYAVRPMLSVSQGRLIALSTPFGLRGWFWREFTGEAGFRRFEITYHDCPRISEEHVAEERRAMGQNWVDQEYLCLFTSMEGLVYPDFSQAIVDMSPTILPKEAIRVGGIDFGWRNPFAAIWGWRDPNEDMIWITGERYARETLLHEHIKHLRRYSHCTWYADPAGATEINECRAGGLSVVKGNNDIALGIAAVTARIRTDRLKVVRLACPDLIEESKLYRYPTAAERAVMGEKPIDSDNHSLAALRYLISRVDQRFIAKLRKRPIDGPPEDYQLPTMPHKNGDDEAPRRRVPMHPWLHFSNPALWPDTEN